MDLLKVVELSHVRITQRVFLWQETPKACRYWDSFLSSQPLSFQTHSFNGCQDPTVSQRWEPEMAEDCLDVVFCCICLFYLVVQSVCDWCSVLSQLAGLTCELAWGTRVLTGSPDLACFKLPRNDPLKLVFCRGSKKYTHDMDLPTGNQGWSHWFRLLSWFLFVCRCPFKLAWLGFPGLQELCAPLETLVCHLTGLELGFCQDAFSLKQGQDIYIYVCVFS